MAHEFGGVSGSAWAAAFAWRPTAAEVKITAWPVGPSDKQRAYDSMVDDADAFRQAAFKNWKIEDDKKLFSLLDLKARELGPGKGLLDDPMLIEFKAGDAKT